MFPIMAIVIGVAVLVFGQRLPVLGAAVGVLLGIGLLTLLPGDSGIWVTLGLPLAFGVIGFFAAGFARGLVEIAVLVVGALGGAAIVLGVLDLFNVDLGILRWLIAMLGGVIGLMLIRRSRTASKDWGLIILAALVGALLVTRGLTVLIPALQGGALATLIAVVVAGGDIAYQGGFLSRDDDNDAAAEST